MWPLTLTVYTHVLPTAPEINDKSIQIGHPEPDKIATFYQSLPLDTPHSAKAVGRNLL